MLARRIRLGLLDFGELPLAAVIRSARVAEERGFSRYWLAEHAGLVENALLATALVAAATSRIRVGPAGVLLRYYAAARVARDGIYLARGFPGRIDLGLAGGRHGGGRDREFLDGRTHLYARQTLEKKIRVVARTVAAHARAAERPQVWLLGTSDSPVRARSAARAAAGFCLSLWHDVTPPSALPLRAYRSEVRRLGRTPDRASIAIALACVASPRERARHRSPHAGVRGKAIVETPAICRERLEELCHAYDVREVSILEGSVGLDRRLASIAMLAEAFAGHL
jgi:alkanesulfonate monooxygenase SsuD/methylene tetrahydromethanopterin reductase-like flavin-dependent oxidoreductase (luciferase family)